MKKDISLIVSDELVRKMRDASEKPYDTASMMDTAELLAEAADVLEALRDAWSLPINDSVPAPTKVLPGNEFLWNWRAMQQYGFTCMAHARQAAGRGGDEVIDMFKALGHYGDHSQGCKAIDDLRELCTCGYSYVLMGAPFRCQ